MASRVLELRPNIVAHIDHPSPVYILGYRAETWSCRCLPVIAIATLRVSRLVKPPIPTLLSRPWQRCHSNLVFQIVEKGDANYDDW